MKTVQVFLVITITLLLGGCEERRPKERCRMEPVPVSGSAGPTRAQMQEELASLKAMVEGPCTPECCEKYILEVIRHGSNVLHYPSSPMDGGFVSDADAPAVAAYTVALTGKKSPHPERVQEGSLLFAGNCAGCHGSDGKGMGGAFPDLTRPELEGMALRKRQMAERIRILEKKLETH